MSYPELIKNLFLFQYLSDLINDVGISNFIKKKSQPTIRVFLLFLLVSSFTINTTALDDQKSDENGFQVHDVMLPFPGTPNETTQEMDRDVMMTHYEYSPEDSHLYYISIVYENLPEHEKQPRKILEGFSLGNTILAEEEIQLSDTSVVYFQVESDTNEHPSRNVIAFVYEENIYVWMVLFQPQHEVGNEDELFLSDLENIRFL